MDTFKAYAIVTTLHGEKIYRSMQVKGDISTAEMDESMKRWAYLLKDEIPAVDSIQITTEETGPTTWNY